MSAFFTAFSVVNLYSTFCMPSLVMVWIIAQKNNVFLLLAPPYINGEYCQLVLIPVGLYVRETRATSLRKFQLF